MLGNLIKLFVGANLASAGASYMLGPENMLTKGMGKLTGSFLGMGLTGSSPSSTTRSDLKYISFRPDGTNDDMVIKRDGNVGIGTTDPSKIFEVYHSENRPVLIKSAGSYNSFIEMDSNRSGANSYTGGIVGKWNGTETASIYFRTGSDTTNKDDGYITFQTAPAGTASERMRITSSGLELQGRAGIPLEL